MGSCCSCLLDGRDRVELKITKQYNPIRLNRKTKGRGVSLSTNGLVVSGAGAALTESPIVQDRVIFEAKVIKNGPFCLGVANEEAIDASATLWLQGGAWVFSSMEQAVSYAGTEVSKLTTPLQFNIGDVITCGYDQESIRFFVNGLPMQYVPPLSVTKLRGLIQAAVWVSQPCQLELIFANEEISYPLHQQGYQGMLIERTMM